MLSLKGPKYHQAHLVRRVFVWLFQLHTFSECIVPYPFWRTFFDKCAYSARVISQAYSINQKDVVCLDDSCHYLWVIQKVRRVIATIRGRPLHKSCHLKVVFVFYPEVKIDVFFLYVINSRRMCCGDSWQQNEQYLPFIMPHFCFIRCFQLLKEIKE